MSILWLLNSWCPPLFDILRTLEGVVDVDRCLIVDLALSSHSLCTSTRFYSPTSPRATLIYRDEGKYLESNLTPCPLRKTV